MTRTARATLVVLAGCTLLAAACDTTPTTPTGPSPAMSPAAALEVPPGPAFQYARAALPGAP